jgi:hypothetical protein
MESVPLDAAGRRRSPVTLPGYYRGRPPRNKGSALRQIRPASRKSLWSWFWLGLPRAHALSCDESLWLLVFDDGSPHTSCATRTLSRWPVKDAAGRNPATARPREPRHHLGLPPGHRQHRDHRHGRSEARTGHPSERRAPTTALTLCMESRSAVAVARVRYFLTANPAVAPAFAEEQERHAVMAETCFAANAGVTPATPATIAIRPFPAPAFALAVGGSLAATRYAAS